jgi:hypothetical protein
MSVASDGTVVIATLTQIVLARGEKRVGDLTVNYQPQAVAAHPTLPELVVAGKVSRYREIRERKRESVGL